MEEKQRVQLSKGILEMKFMKKSKEKAQKEKECEEGQTMYSKEITDEMRKTGNLLFVEASIYHCKDLLEGRLSFGGMNADIEKLMANDHNKKVAEAEALKEKDLTDAEMAQGYSTLVNTMSKKFQSKRKR